MPVSTLPLFFFAHWKLTAVFSDSAGATFVTLVGLNGRLLWMRCIRYSSPNPTTLNASNDKA